MTESPIPVSRRPRIGYLLKTYPRFSQTFVVNEILELERQGVEIAIASLRKPSEGMFHEAISRVRARAHYIPETFVSEFERVRSAQWSALKRDPRAYARAIRCILGSPGADWMDLVQAALLLHWAKKNEVDHVHVHFGSNEATVALLANVLGGLSYSMTLHAFDIFRKNVDRRLLARKINASRFTVTVTEYNRRFLTTCIPGVIAEKVRVNYNGVDLRRFDPRETGRDPRLIFSVGRLIEKKGFIHLIRAVGLLREQGVKVQCKIVGEGRDKQLLKDAIRAAGLKSSVELVGPLEHGQVLDLMHQAGCFVLPCVQAQDGNLDALPTVLLEALAAGCPAVSTRISGVPEIIEDGVSGLLVAPGDEPALAAAIQRIVKDSSQAARLGEQGRRRAEDLFDIARNVSVMKDWLLAAVSGPGLSDELRLPAELHAKPGRANPLMAGAS